MFGKLTTDPKAIYDGETAWSAALPTLQPLVTSASRVVTSNAMKALYYFGRYDYDLNATIVPETQSGQEFGLDERTGRHAISTAQSIAQVLGMPGTTIVILEEMRLGIPAGVPADAVDTIAARCSVVVVPAGCGSSSVELPERQFPMINITDVLMILHNPRAARSTADSSRRARALGPNCRAFDFRSRDRKHALQPRGGRLRAGLRPCETRSGCVG